MGCIVRALVDSMLRAGVGCVVSSAAVGVAVGACVGLYVGKTAGPYDL